MTRAQARNWAAALALACAPALPSAAPGAELGLSRALALAEQNSPALRAARQRVLEAGADVEASASFYYPHLVAAAAGGTGLAGSPGLVPDGVAGVLGSPFAAGPRVGADLSASWDVLDVGAMLSHSAARDARVSSEAEERFERVQVDQTALIGYLQAAQAQGSLLVWSRESARLERTYALVRYYESVGRYSEDQMLLLKEMLAASRLEQALARQSLRDALQDLAVTLGVPDGGFTVPDPASLDPKLPSVGAGTANPLMAYAQAQAEAAHHRAQAALAQALPRVFANASLGNVDQTLVVPDKDYSASVGVALPLFEGFQTRAGYVRARAAARESDELLGDTRLRVAHADDRYDDAVALDRLSLDSLASRLKDARTALSQAQYRYLRLTGPLSDLQQALADLVGIEAGINAARADLLTNVGAQRLFNGGTPAPGPDARP